MAQDGKVALLQNYIDRCNEIIDTKNIGGAETLIKEITSALSSINGIKAGLDMYSPGVFVSYGGTTVSSPDPDYLGDVQKLKGKLEVEMAKAAGDHGQQERSIEKINKPHKLFISHSSKDKEYMVAFVELLEDIGMPDDAIICSSVPGHGIPNGAKIYEWLRSQFLDCDLHVVFALSHNYYESAASLNEMGAAWLTKATVTLLLLPGFDFKDIKGCIDYTEMGIKLDEAEDELKHRLGGLKDTLVSEYSLAQFSGTRWERRRDAFIKKVREITAVKQQNKNVSNNKEDEFNPQTVTLSPDAVIFLAYAGADDGGEVIVSHTLGVASISAGKWDFVRDGGAREDSRWMAVVKELEDYGLLEAVGYKREIFKLTYEGFKASDKAREQIDTEKSPYEYLG